MDKIIVPKSCQAVLYTKDMYDGLGLVLKVNHIKAGHFGP